MANNQQIKRMITLKDQVKQEKIKVLNDNLREQWRYAWFSMLSDMWQQPIVTLLTVIVITISITVPNIYYVLWKNVSQTAEQWYPVPQLTLYLSKSIDDSAVENIVTALEKESGVAKVKYLSRNDALNEFRNWSGFGSALDMLEQNPLPAVVIITPKFNFHNEKTFQILLDQVKHLDGIDDIHVEDDNLLIHLVAFIGSIWQFAAMIGIIMIISVFLVISNIVRLNIFAKRDIINVQKLIGATDSFIVRPFLYSGILLGLIGAIFSMILSELFLYYLETMVTKFIKLFGIIFHIRGFSFYEMLLMLLLSAIIGWIAAWLATIQHLRSFMPQ